MRGGALTVALALSACLAPGAEAYRFAGERWPGTKIRLANEAPRYSASVRRALRIWGRAKVGTRFVRAPSARARVIIRYSSGSGRGPTGCEGKAGAAFGGYPGPFFKVTTVFVVRDCKSRRVRDLTIAHELGHVLGLGHENRRCTLMNARASARTGLPSQCPQAGPRARRMLRRLMTPDDVRGVRALYSRPFEQLDPKLGVAQFNSTFDQGPYTGAPLQFNAVVRNPRLDYRWSFGDPASGAANAASGMDVMHTFPGPGTFTVTLSVFDGGAVIAELSKPITLF